VTAPSLTAHALLRVARPLRSRRLGAAAAGMAGSVLALLGVAAWLARLGVFGEPGWVPAVWVLALLLAGAGAWLARRRLALLDLHAVARWLERVGAWRLGALRGVLDPAQSGASDELARAADERLARDVEARGAGALEPMARALGREARLAGGVLLGGLALLGTSQPFRGAPSLLWHPVKAWSASVAPVRLAASATEVARGEPVRFDIAAFGRREAILWLRAPGEPWRRVDIQLDSAGVGAHDIAALEHDVHARVTSGDRESDTVLVQVRQPVFLAAVSVTARYPAYLGLEDEAVPTSGDTVLVPAGTKLEVTGEVTTALAGASWSGPEAQALATDGARFSGTFTPRQTGAYRLVLVTASGAPVAGDPVVLPITVAPDLPPVLEIPVPGADTNASPDLRVPVVVDARDDHGLHAVAIESRRVSALGERSDVRRDELPLPAERTDRALLGGSLDLAQLGAQPGDTVRYWAVASDNSPGRQGARSREFVLRILTRAEQRAEQRKQTDALGGKLDSLADASRKLERQTEDLARSQPRDAASQGNQAQDLSFEQAQKAEAVAQAQQQLMEEAEQAKEALAELDRSAQAAGIADSAWQARMADVRQQLERALSPELRQKLQELRDALKDLDAERTQDALKNLAERQEQLREALERSKELFERAAMEGDLQNLAQESRELAQEQQRWNEQLAGADSARAAAQEQQLAARADSLAKALEQLAKDMDGMKPERGEAMQQAAESAQQAAQQMKQAAQAAKKGQKPEAKQQGKKAEEQLKPLGDELDEQREDLAQEWQEEVMGELDRALADASRLGERQLAVQQAFERGDNVARTRAEQAAVEEGVQRLAQQLRETSGKNALVSPQLSGALGAAQRQMAKAREAVGSANPNAREASDRAGDALDALNAAAHGLLRARGDVSGSQSGSGLAEAMERMQQMAGQQGQLSQDAAGLLPMMGGAGGRPDQMAQLAQRQRALAEQLERMRGQGNMPGAGELSNEAADLAKRLEAGRLDRGTVERQERLFRRMLDAGRTLQGEKEDERKERESTTARGDSVRIPPALRRQLEDDAGRVRLPTWEELQRLSPAERRIVVDYFRRLSVPAP
jgi:hypothetical protein